MTPDAHDRSPWSAPGTVSGFAQAPPNAVLMRYAAAERARVPNGALLDLGCGAGRNGVPLAAAGWAVTGVDDSGPMLVAAAGRARAAGVESRTAWLLAPMDALPVRAASADLIVAHGIWNLARSGDEFRHALKEAARTARPGAGLFLFTFSRHTLPEGATPVAGERFVFTNFSGSPQVFLDERQLHDELAAAGFAPDPAVPLTEYNRPAPGAPRVGSAPVIWEAAFRHRA